MLSSILGMIVATALAVAVYWISVKDNKKTSHKTHEKLISSHFLLFFQTLIKFRGYSIVYCFPVEGLKFNYFAPKGRIMFALEEQRKWKIQKE